MRPTAALSVLILAVMAGPAFAGGVLWRSDYDTALEEAQRRNVPLVLVYMGDAAGFTPAFNSLASYLNQYTVPVVGQQETAHGTKKVKLQDPRTGKVEEKEVCKVHGHIHCDDHRNIWQVASQTAGFVGGGTVPAAWVIGTDGKALFDFKKVDAKSAGSVKSHVEKARKQLGPGLAYSQYLGILRSFDQAKALADAKQYAKAIKMLKKQQVSLEKKKLKGMVEALKEQLDMIDIEGQKLVDTAESESDPAKKKKQLLHVKTTFAGLPSAERATKLLTGK